MKTLLRRLVKILAAVFLVAVLLLAAGGVYAARGFARRWDVPAPSIRAATSPAAVARGAALFRSECALCHAGPSGRASGKQMTDVPPFLGIFHAANLTAHPTAGVGARSDGELARVIRNGVQPDGTRTVGMPTYPRMSDDDVAAVLGFLRSPEPDVVADATVRPRPAPSFAGKLILAFVVGLEPERAEATVAAPAREPSAAYGAYLANDVLHCWGCHTSGYSEHKLEEPGAYAGGLEFRDEQGRPLVSPNITPDPETGVGRWSDAELVRAIRDGIRPDGSAIGPPMGRFRGFGDDELAAMVAYLRTVPAVHNRIERAPRPSGSPTAAAALFAKSGCVVCHGPGAPFREKLRDAAARPVEEVTERILHAERYNPATVMPTFAGTLDEASARALAEYVRAEGASPERTEGAEPGR